MKLMYDKNRNRYTLPMKVLSVILAFIMAFSGGIISCYAMGAGVPEKLEMESILSGYIKDVIDLDGVKSIDIEKSTDTELYLNMKDDSTTVYTFSEPVTYIDENGDLKCKDNIIVKQTDDDNKDLGYEYSNDQNNYRINVSSNSSIGILVEYNDISFSLSPVSDLIGKGYVSKDKTSFEYTDLYGTNSSIKYYSQINGVKEEIILNSKTDTNIFSSILKTKDCAPIINEDGSLSLISSQTGKEVQRFVAPFAYDSEYVVGIFDEHFCSDCEYNLEKVTDNEYVLSVAISSEWLNSDATVYPVTIDPTTSNIYNYADASVYSADPTTNYGSNQTCGIGYNSELGNGRIYTKFTMPSDIKKYAAIHSAELWESELTEETTTMSVTPYLVTDSWTETSITWDNKPEYDSDSAMESKTIDGNSTDDPYDSWLYKFDITSAVEQWISGVSNNGIVLISSVEEVAEDNWKSFAAQNYTSTDYRPYTVINYTNDVRAPRITSITGNPTDWTNEIITLSVTATDEVYAAVSGIEAYSFSRSADDFIAQTGSSKAVSTNGTYYVRVRDNAGNVSAPTIVEVNKVDRDKPSTPTINGVPTTQVKDEVLITAYSEDELSGVKAYSFSTESGVYNWQKENTKVITENGTYYICAKDNAGNISDEVSVDINKIVKNRPLDPIITGNATEWTNENVTLTAVPTDDEDDIIQYSFSTNSSTYLWQTNPYKVFTSNCTVYPSFKHSDGEISTADPVIIDKIDKTSPSEPKVSSTYEESKTILTVTSSDSGSGLAAYSFSTEQGTYDWQESNIKEFSENTTVYIYARDVAGNISSATTKKVYVGDVTAPTFTNVTGNPTNWTSSSVTLTINGAEDSETGLHETAYSFSDKENEYDWQSSKSKSFTSNQTVYIHIRDDAGNVAYVDTVIIDKIDKEKPTIDRITRNDKNGITTLTIEASDSKSGVVSYSINSGAWSSDNNISFETDKYNYVTLYVRDGAGNTNSELYIFYYPRCYKENGKVYVYNPNPKATNDTIYYRTSRVIFTSWEKYTGPFSAPNDKIYLTYIQPTLMISRDVSNALTIYTSSIKTLRTPYVAGKYEESDTDATFTYKGVSFDFLRTYDNSNNSWFFSVNSSLTYNKSENCINAILPDNTKITFLPKTPTSYYDVHSDYIINTNKDADGNILSFSLELNGIIYNYGASGKLDYVSNKNGDKITFTRNDGEIIVVDGAGREYIVSLYASSNIVSITDPAGGVIKYTYNSNKQLTKVVDQAGVTLDTYSYDSNGRVSKHNDKSYTYDSSGRITSEDYDSGAYNNYAYVGNTVNIETSKEQTSEITYNEFGDITYTKDDDGNTVNYTFDSKRRVIKEETSNGECITYSYDSNGLLLNSENGENRSSYSYDANGNCIREETISDAETSYIYYVYDSAGNIIIIATLKEDYNGTAPSQYDENLTCFDTIRYDYSNGLLAGTVNNKDNENVSYGYDAYGNVAKSISSVVKDEETITTTVTSTYDLFGNVLTTTSGEETSSYIYDAAGRLLLSSVNGECTRRLYDNLGRVIQEIGPKDYDSTKDGLPEENTYADSKVGQTYNYASNGTLTSETNRIGRTTKYFYNDIGSLEREEFDIYKFYYLNHGELYQVKVANATTLTYDYDDNHKLISESYANDDVIRYTYNDNGDVIAQYHNSNAKPYVTFTYNDNNFLTEKVNTDTGLKYIYGEDGQVSVYKASDNTLVYSYAEVETEADEDTGIEAYSTITENHFGTSYNTIIKNNSISYKDGNKTVEYSYSKGSSGLIASAFAKNNNRTALSLTYSYDDNGNITSKLYSYNNKTLDFVNAYDKDGRIIASGKGSASLNYTYDDYDQVINVQGVDYSANYTYDSRGNITSKTVNGETTTFTYANTGWKDLLLAVNDIELTYDSNGNVLSCGDKEYTWNSGRNLESITDDDNFYSYKYNEEGIRTSKTVNGKTTYFNTKDGVILAQSNGINTIYFQYDNSGTPIGFIFNGTQYFYITNQMGDVIGITNESGNLLAEYSYDEWGNILSIQASDSNLALANINPLRYRGYYYDTETGYYYLQSRYYDPNICRFINSDDAKFIVVRKNVVPGINQFAYCENNPINSSDHTGYWAEKYSGFKWTSTGFNLNVNLAFITKAFCLIYAADILVLKKTLFYKGMSLKRMAVELYFHAVMYYATKTLLKIGISNSTIKSWNTSAKYMEINYDDKRAIFFYLLWDLPKLFY